MKYWVVFDKEQNGNIETFTDMIYAPSKAAAAATFTAREERTNEGTITDIQVFTEKEFENWMKE